MKEVTVFTPEVCSRIAKLIDEGYRTSEIAKKLEIKSSSLSRYMYKNNLVCKPNEEKKRNDAAYPAKLIRDWDTLHRWYLQYRRRYPKKISKGGLSDGYSNGNRKF